MCVCVCIYQSAHNRAIRPCHPSHSMPLALILAREDQWYLCVCVFFPIFSGRQVRWMYQPESHRRKVTQNSTSTFLLPCMSLFFSREGFSSFPSSTVKSTLFFISPTIKSFSNCWAFFFWGGGGKIPVTGIRTHVPTYQMVTRLPTELPGRPTQYCNIAYYVLDYKLIV